MQGALATYSTLLQFMGAFVAFSIAYVSWRGIRETESPTLIRLATAFVFLGFGFMVEGLVGAGNVPLVPGLTAFATTLIAAGLLLETTGYFFLAFSHAIDVAMSKRNSMALIFFPVIAISGAQLADILKILSFYFVMYGFVETTYSYSKNRRPDTFVIALGLGLIAAGAFFEWLSLIYPAVNVLSLIQIITKQVGLLALFIPVIKFSLGKVKWNGTI